MVKSYKRDFEPSFRILSRLLKILLEKDPVSKTELSQAAGINYCRLLKHLDWLDAKRIIQLTVERHKVAIKLTPRGREFAMILLGNNNR